MSRICTWISGSYRKGESTLVVAKEASEAHESMKDTIQDDCFGVDVELQNINEFVFISKYTCNDHTNISYKMRKVPVQMQGESSVPSKKGKENGFAKDQIDDSLFKHMGRFYDICDAIN